MGQTSFPSTAIVDSSEFGRSIIVAADPSIARTSLDVYNKAYIDALPTGSSFDQSLNTTDDVQFDDLTATGNVVVHGQLTDDGSSTYNAVFQSGTDGFVVRRGTAEDVSFGYQGIQLSSGGGLYWSQYNGNVGSGRDTYISRAAAGIVALGNSQYVDEHSLRVYNSVDGSGNDEWFEIDWHSEANKCILRTNASGTGTVRDLEIEGFSTGLTYQDASADFTAVAGNYYRIDLSGASADLTGTLPASHVEGDEIAFEVVATHATHGFLMDRNGQTVGGETDMSQFRLQAVNDLIWLRSNGTYWNIEQESIGGNSSFDQDLNTTDDVEFASATFTGTLIANNGVNINLNSSHVRVVDYDGPGNEGLEIIINGIDYDGPTMLTINGEEGFVLDTIGVDIDVISAFNFRINSTPKLIIQETKIDSSVDILPASDLAYDLGSESFRWGNIFAGTVTATSFTGISGIVVDELFDTGAGALYLQMDSSFIDNDGVLSLGDVDAEGNGTTVVIDDGLETVFIGDGTTISREGAVQAASFTGDGSGLTNLPSGGGDIQIANVTTKTLSANVTASGTISEFTFADLTVGKQYQVILNGFLQPGSNDNFGIDITHDGIVIGTQWAFNRTNELTFVNDKSVVFFTATATTLTFDVVSYTSPSVLDSTSFVQLIEYVSADQTTYSTETADFNAIAGTHHLVDLATAVGTAGPLSDIFTDDFESGQGSWVFNGSNASISTLNPRSGSNSLRLHNSSGTASIDLDLPNGGEVELWAKMFNTSVRLSVQADGVEIGSLAGNTTYSQYTVSIPAGTSQLRFLETNSSVNVYIDDIVVRAYGETSITATLPASPIQGDEITLEIVSTHPALFLALDRNGKTLAGETDMDWFRIWQVGEMLKLKYNGTHWTPDKSGMIPQVGGIALNATITPDSDTNYIVPFDTAYGSITLSTNQALLRRKSRYQFSGGLRFSIADSPAITIRSSSDTTGTANILSVGVATVGVDETICVPSKVSEVDAGSLIHAFVDNVNGNPFTSASGSLVIGDFESDNDGWSASGWSRYASDATTGTYSMRSTFGGGTRTLTKTITASDGDSLSFDYRFVSTEYRNFEVYINGVRVLNSTSDSDFTYTTSWATANYSLSAGTYAVEFRAGGDGDSAGDVRVDNIIHNMSASGPNNYNNFLDIAEHL